MLVFIPNEQIYQYVHEHDSGLIDYALSSKVVLCSPVSLYAILGVIWQAVDNFAVEQSSNEIISELGKFEHQWGMFLGKMESLGKRIEAAQKDYGDLVGTRRRGLERPLRRINAIRERRGLELPPNSELGDQLDLEDSEFGFAESLTEGE